MPSSVICYFSLDLLNIFSSLLLFQFAQFVSEHFRQDFETASRRKRRKKTRRLLQAFFNPEGRGRTGQAAPRSHTAPCRPQKPKCQQARKKIDPSRSVFGQRTGQHSWETYGGCPRGPEKEREPLEGAPANHPWTARVPLDPPAEPQRGGQEIRASRKLWSC